MFLPAFRPSDVQGQTLKINAYPLGVGLVEVHGKGFLAGLLFREDTKIFMVHSEVASCGSELHITDVGERAVAEIQGFRETIAGLMERINADREVIKELRAQGEIDKTAIAMLREATKEMGDLRVNARRLDSEMVEVRAVLESTQMELQRYIDIVGPIDPPAKTDDAPTLDFGDDSVILENMQDEANAVINPPPPPPVVEVSAEDRGTVLPRDWNETNKPPVDSDLL